MVPLRARFTWILLMGIACLGHGDVLRATPAVALGQVSGIRFLHVKEAFSGNIENSIILDNDALQWMEKEFKAVRTGRFVRKARKQIADDFLAVLDRIKELPSLASTSVLFKCPYEPERSFVVQLVFKPVEGGVSVPARGAFRKNVRMYTPDDAVPAHILNFIKTCILQKAGTWERAGMVAGAVAAGGVLGLAVSAVQQYARRYECARLAQDRCCASRSAGALGRTRQIAEMLQAGCVGHGLLVTLQGISSDSINYNGRPVYISYIDPQGAEPHEQMRVFFATSPEMNACRIFVVGLSQLSSLSSFANRFFDPQTLAQRLKDIVAASGSTGLGQGYSALSGNGRMLRIIVVNDYDVPAGSRETGIKEGFFEALNRAASTDSSDAMNSAQIKALLAPGDDSVAKNLLELRRLMIACNGNASLEAAQNPASICIVQLKAESEEVGPQECWQSLVASIAS